MVNLDDLAVRAAEYKPDAVELSTATRALLDNGDQDVQVIDVLGNILASTGPLAVSLEAALRSRGVGLTPLVGSYRQFLHTEPTRQRETAGSLLRIWLRERMPRVPVDVPRYRSDGIDEDSDLVGIQTEADAFAYLIAARDLAPPLAVGLFGGWGSGKEFPHAGDPAAGARPRGQGARTPRPSAVWQDIRQVEFNAWEYVQGNVWAGLLERIFATLGTLPERTSVVDAVRAPVTVVLEAAQRSVSDAETERAQSTDAVAAKREEVLDAEARVRERRFDAPERWAAQDGTAAAARDVLATYWQEHRAALLGKDGAELVEALGEVGASCAAAGRCSARTGDSPGALSR